MYLRQFNPNRPLLLATDLDGTFLGGSFQDRQILYSLIDSNRSRVRLMFVTGRSFANVLPLFDELALPDPDYLICDVGTSVFNRTGNVLFEDLQHDIVQRWGNGQAAVAEALADLPLRLQQNTGYWRRSYLYDHEPVAQQARRRVEDLGFDGLLSDDQYFDVLPRGVNKGSTLLRVVGQLGFDAASVLAAGDTLNDLSMLTCGLPAVAVANSEPRLLASLPDLPAIFRATRPGAAGILEAIEGHPALN